MKWLSLLLVFVSFSALADQTCLTPAFQFRITKHFIEAINSEDIIRLPFTEVRSISLDNSRNNFILLTEALADSRSTDGVLTENELSRLDRFSLTLADESEAMVMKRLIYLKGFDRMGLLVVRFMMVDQAYFRCQ